MSLLPTRGKPPHHPGGRAQPTSSALRKPGASVEAKPRPEWHVQYLDALRGWAILGVLMVHTTCTPALPLALFRFTFSGQRGVQLFFVVSAFTLALSHDKRSRVTPHPTRNFFLRRFFRLAPLYYLAMLLTLFTFPELSGNWKDRLLGVLFLQGLSIRSIVHVAPGTWTIADEAFFYCSLPLLLSRIRTLRAAMVWLLVLGPLLAGLSYVLAHHDPRNAEFYTFFWFPAEFPVFLIGLVAYFFWKERIAPAPGSNAQITRRRSLLLLGAAAVLYAWFTAVAKNHTIYLSGLCAACALLALSMHPWRLIVNRATVYLGRISYSMYLLHGWLILWIERHTEAWRGTLSLEELLAIRFLLAIPLVAAVASLSWLLIEENGVELGRRVIAHLEHRTARAAQALSTSADLFSARSSTADEQF